MIWNTLLQIIIGCILIYISIIDLLTQKITNRSLAILLAAGLGATWQSPLTMVERIIGTLVSSAPLLVLSVMQTGAFGGGDIKLAAVAGGILGYVRGLMSLGISFLVGGVYGIALLITGRARKVSDKFAFGPFICIGIAYCIYFVNS